MASTANVPVVTVANDNTHDQEKELILRPVATYSPTLWGEIFSSYVLDNELLEKYGKEIEAMKEKVRDMLLATCEKWVEKLNLIDTVERLGLSYHFEEEIDEQMTQILNANPNFASDDEGYDLHTVALYFRLFRQHGHYISCDAFNKFLNSNGKFKDTLASDVKGLLSLFEAAHVRMHGEDVLEDAIALATTSLESAMTHLSPIHAKHVAHTLEQVIQRDVPRLGARHYISVYEEDESRNELLLKFAKVDFNRVQMLHKQELHELTRWWQDFGLVPKLTYARDRLVECYFWANGVYFEPEYAKARIMLTKTITVTSVVDDTYDSYGTIDELQLFTDAVERWDISCVDTLPEYMKVCYRALLKLYEDYESELAPEGRSFAVSHARNAMKELVRSYNVEAKWFIDGYTPPFEEYLKNALVTCTYYLMSASSYLGMKEAATNDAFDWLLQRNKMLVALVTICRLIDDVATYKDEKGRGLATGIDCYMKQHGASKQETTDKFLKMCEDSWKDVSEEWIKTKSVSKKLLMPILNLIRIIDVTYKNNEDGYTHPEKVLKKHILALYVNPIDI